MAISIAVFAQAQTSTNRPDQASKTSSIIERQLVRFTTQGETVEWHLVITNQQDEIIFDSGPVYSVALEWPFKNQQGEPVASGLYAYTLTTKAATDETARTQRGHLIVDRASSSDRVWLTSTKPIGVGADSAAPQVTVRDSVNATASKAKLPAGAPANNFVASSRSLSERGKEAKNDLRPTPDFGKSGPDRGLLLRPLLPLTRLWGRSGESANAAGLVQLNKMSIEGNLSVGHGYSSSVAPADGMIVQGSVGIGTTNPLRTLQLGSSTDAAFTFEPGGSSANAGFIRFGDNTGWRLHIGRNRECSQANQGQACAQLNTGTTGVLMTIQDNGNVGIGVPTNGTPQTKLDVRGDVKLGNTGQLFAPGGEENLRIIRGVFDKTGNRTAGFGFTAARNPNFPNSTGDYIVTFDTSFSAPPAVTAVTDANGAGTTFVQTFTVTANFVRFLVYRPDGTSADAIVQFIAIGPR
jgi:hypothetical protein